MSFPSVAALSTVAIACSGVAALAVGSHAAPRRQDPPAVPAAVANDNRTPAGTWHGDTLVLRLVAQDTRWYIHDEADGAFLVPAFGEEGKPPSVPGPLIRVRAGTPIRVSVRNAMADTLVVRGLTSRALVRRDSLLIVPGATAETRFVADREGSYFYWVASSATPPQRRLRPVSTSRTSQLTGAFVVDPAGDALISPDRVFVITELFDTPGGRPIVDPRGFPLRDFVVFNGKSWPHTERMAYALGDSIRWRIINAGDAPHSLHLHGFYYRVASTGSNAGDSVLPVSPPRMAVTEQVLAGHTTTLVWVPDRPGGWIFHCHMTPHIARHPPIDKPDVVDLPTGHLHGDPDDHLATGMNGLLLATRVTGPAPARAEPATRRLRVFVQSDSAPGDSGRRFGYVLQRDDAEPARDSLEAVPPALILYRDQPTSIEVVNQSGEATAVHWHGMELESYFDGVVGFGGTPGRLTPAIRPGTSFTARMTPPRAGTFMYHTHFDELRQQFGGLIGPLIVLEPGEVRDPERDRVMLIAEAYSGATTLNGSTRPPPLELSVGGTYRLRFANIAVDRPLLTVYLMGDSVTYATWRPVAKDGWTLDSARATPGSAWHRVGTGETADFEYTPDAAGDYILELRAGNPARGGADRTRPLILTQRVRVHPERE